MKGVAFSGGVGRLFAIGTAGGLLQQPRPSGPSRIEGYSPFVRPARADPTLQKGDFMADSQPKLDWTTVRQMASECLRATWDLVWWAGQSQEDDYDVDSAALHLAAIDNAADTLTRAIHVFQLHHFDSIAKASVGEGPRPDFWLGGVCCATAHQTAFELLRVAVLWVETGMNDELDDRGIGDQYIASIDDLHELSPEALRDTLSHLERRKSLNCLPDGWTNRIIAWITREWAAVSQSPAKADQMDGALAITLTPEEKTILETLANEGSMTVTQEGLAGQTRLSDKTVRKYLALLRTCGLVDQPRGPKKGFGITPTGLAAIGHK